MSATNAPENEWPDPPKLSERCMIHSDRMWEEGWYVTSIVLKLAADKLKEKGE